MAIEIDGKVLCGARTSDGTPCEKPPSKGRTRCRKHGGASPVGMASATYVDGRYSKYIGGELLAKYETARNDPDLLALRDEISIVDARIAELLARVSSGESGGTWRRLGQVWENMLEARARGDTAMVQFHFGKIGGLISDGLGEHAAWDGLHRAITQRARLVETERRRLEAMSQLMTAEQAMAMVTLLADSVKRHVSDKDALRAISADLARFGGARPVPPPGS
jgi:hypothetical protein